MGAVGKMSDSLGVNQSKPVEATEVDDLTGDVAAFFDQHEAVYPLMHQASSHFSLEQPGRASPVSVGARLVSGAASVIPLPRPISPPGICAGETP